MRVNNLIFRFDVIKLFLVLIRGDLEMSDFDENWQIKGSLDPATPAVQPNQVQSEPVVNSPYQPQPAPFVPSQAQTVPGQQAPVMQQPYQPAPVIQPQMQQGYPQSQVVQPQMQPGQPAYQVPAYQQMPGMGYSYPTQPMMYNSAFAQAREAALAEMNVILNHFAPKVDVYQKYENVNKDIQRFSKTSIAPLVWGIIVSLIGIALVVDGIFGVKHEADKVPYYIAGAIFIAFAAGLIVMFVLKKINHKKKKEALIEEAGELSNQLFLLYNGCGNCPVGSEYTDPRILFKLQAIIISGRCATIPEALSTLLTLQRNYQRIEQAKTQFAAETAERYDGKPAFFNAIRYFNLM
jgi:hypothetical protein